MTRSLMRSYLKSLQDSLRLRGRTFVIQSCSEAFGRLTEPLPGGRGIYTNYIRIEPSKRRGRFEVAFGPWEGRLSPREFYKVVDYITADASMPMPADFGMPHFECRSLPSTYSHMIH